MHIYIHFRHYSNIDWNNIKILASDSKEINLSYSESFLILKQKPSLNKLQTSVKINLFTY